MYLRLLPAVALALAIPGQLSQAGEARVAAALERHQQAVEDFNAHNIDGVADYYSAEAILHDPQYPEPLHGREAIRATYEQMIESFPDMRVEIESRYATEGRIMYQLRLIGTNHGPLPSPEGELPPTGESIDVPVAVFADIDADGRFMEVRRYYDVALMMQQLGLVE
jgi:steroid delta-isomerase-like uncharacterized protein